MADFRTFAKMFWGTGTDAMRTIKTTSHVLNGNIQDADDYFEKGRKLKKYTEGPEEQLEKLNLDLDLLEEIQEVERRLSRLGMTKEEAKAKLEAYFGERK